MRYKLTMAVLLCVGLLRTVSAHDLFLKFDSYFLRSDTASTVRLLNGTFRTSENPVTRDRMADVSIINPKGERANPPAADWRDEGSSALLNFQTGEAGTYVIGLYTKPRDIALKAAQFNNYLVHDGLPDILAARKKNTELNKDAREQYSKHVKAMFQVGEARTDSYKTLGYPVEIIPQQNPYTLKVGDAFAVLCVKDGQPLANQYVLTGHEVKGRELPPVSARSNDRGLARIKLTGAGKWYVKFIHMMPVNDQQINYESKWATLTFEVK